MAEHLAAWRKAYTEKEKLAKESSKTACQKLATQNVLSLLQKMPIDPERTSLSIYVEPTTKNVGRCNFQDFEPIMRQQCLKSFGEKCRVAKGYDEWGGNGGKPPIYWEVEFDVQLKY